MGLIQKLTFSALSLLMVAAHALPALAQLKGGVEQEQVLQNGYSGGATYPAYPSPVMVPQTPTQAPVRKPPPLNANIQQSQRPTPQPPRQPPRQPIQATVQQTAPPGVLPAVFLGAWQVLGQRSKVEALPQYQEAVGGIFATSNSQVWQISGNPQQGYSLSSDTGVQTAIMVDKVSGNTAYLRYQHPIKNTMAREAIVMQLSPDGSQFQGMERISIVKQGEPGPRAQVQYNLIGRRR